MALEMANQCIVAIVMERFEGHRPSHPWRKAHPLAQLRGLSPTNPTCWRRIWGWLERVYGPQNVLRANEAVLLPFRLDKRLI